MSAVEIVALRCPSCGNASNVPEKELRFGYQFTCPYCGTVSVLIINRMLYIPLPGERVCVKCGRVAPRGARFCQCGASLVRTCINPECYKEFPVDHSICDYCGWPQDVKRAISDLSNPNPEIQEKACWALGRIGPAASEAVPVLVELIRHSQNQLVLGAACGALRAIGPAASEAVPALVELIRRSQNPLLLNAACWALKAIGPAASEVVPALVELIICNPDLSVFWAACEALEAIGPAALPKLRSLIDWPFLLDKDKQARIKEVIERIEKKHGKR
jgi:hypothetical protein